MNDALTFELSSSLHAGQEMLATLDVMTGELFSAFACMGMTLATLQAAVSGRGTVAGVSFVRTLGCFAAFTSYDEIFVRLIACVDETTNLLQEKSGMKQLLQIAMTSTAEVLAGKGSYLDMIAGIFKGGYLVASSLAGLVALAGADQVIVWVTKVALCCLYCVGPVMIAVGTLGERTPMGSWFNLTLQVLMWPIFASFVGIAYVHVGGDVAMASDGLLTSLTSTLILAALIFCTPLSVFLLMSKGGVSAIGVFLGGAAFKLVGGALSAGLSTIGGPAGAAFGRSLMHGAAYTCKSAMNQGKTPRPDSTAKYSRSASTATRTPANARGVS